MNFRDSKSLLFNFSAIIFFLHIIVNALGGYGIFRDELYYLACSNNLDFGYVDHPPLSIYILFIWKSIFGESLFMLRFIPALLSGMTLYFAGKITLELGGKIFALTLTAITVGLSPIYLAFFGLYTMNSIDIFLWTIVIYYLLQFNKTNDTRYWYLIGLFLGLGALNKISMIWLGFGIFVGVLLTSHRKLFLKKDIWLAAAIALIIFSPYIKWNILHEFAHLEFIKNAAGEKYSSQNPLTFISGFLMLFNPLSIVVWISGFYFLLKEKTFRLIGFSILSVLIILIINIHTKSEYFAAGMVVVLSAGSVFIEKIIVRKNLAVLKYGLAFLLLILNLILLPITLDVLPVKTFINYSRSIMFTPPSTEGQKLNDLPQHYADRFGWQEMVDSIAKVWNNIPVSERDNFYIYGRNYGEAAAVDYYGKKYGLPPAIAQHNSYYWWSMKYLNQNMKLIVLARNKSELENDFEFVQEVGFIQSEYAMSYESNLHIYICKKLKHSDLKMWKQGKTYI